jgi:hypothetical protein
VEAAGGGNYQTLINSALREYVREASSQIAEDMQELKTIRKEWTKSRAGPPR